VDEAEVRARRYSSLNGKHYVFHEPQKLAEKYPCAWNDFEINIGHIRNYF